MKPSHALSVWLEDQTLCVELPGTGEHSHTIKLQSDNYSQLFAILRERGPQSMLGEAGDPTQWQIDKGKVPLGKDDIVGQIIAEAKAAGKVRRVGKPKVEMTVEQRAAIDQILREMGIA